MTKLMAATSGKEAQVAANDIKSPHSLPCEWFSCDDPTTCTRFIVIQKTLYSPMGKVFILQPDENSSPPHPLLPLGCALYALDNTQCGSSSSVLKAFLNSPHPLETLSDPTAYGSEGTIVRDHDSCNYLKAMNMVVRRRTRMVARKVRKQRSLLWQLLNSPSLKSDYGDEYNS